MRIGRDLIVTLGLAGGGLLAATAPAVPALGSGQVCAGIVIDHGTGTAPVRQGASVPPGSSDLDLLSAAGDTFTQNNAGLVCVINGYPANGLQNCLDAAHGLYYYWSYWEGDPATNTWTYADVGPAEHTVTAGQSYVEGWRYQDPGPDSPAATTPSVKPAAAFAHACQSGPPVTTTTESPPGTGGSVTTTTPRTSATATSAVPRAPATAARTPGSTGSQPTSTVTTEATQRGDAPGPPGAAGGLPSSTTSTSSGARQPRTSAQLALSHEGGPKRSSGDPALPILVVVALIGILGFGAWHRWRRPAEE
jgi:hypothetical protein